MRLEVLREMLLERKYRPTVIDAAFKRIKTLTREESLKKVDRPQSEKTVFVTTYDPRLPRMGPLLQKHYKTLIMDPHMKDIYGQGMIVAHKRHRNIQELLFRARLYDINQTTRPARLAKKGWRKCSGCTTCNHSENRTKVICNANKETWQISQDINCKNHRTIYIIECRKDHLQYVGKSVQTLMDRGRQHIQLAQSRTHPNKLYQHFSTNGHTHADMLIFGIERVHGDDFVLAARERYYIDKFQTIYKGLNSNRT